MTNLEDKKMHLRLKLRVRVEFELNILFETISSFNPENLGLLELFFREIG